MTACDTQCSNSNAPSQPSIALRARPAAAVIRRRAIVLALTLCPLLSSGSAALAQSIDLFVDANAPGPVHDGSSWATAFRTPEPAFAVARPAAVIAVAAGTYSPSGGSSASFTVPPGVQLYGGFAPGGDGASCAQHRPTPLAAVVLDGDLGEGAHSNHVVRLGNGSLVDGFTIRNGHADGALVYEHDGGGVYYTGNDPETTLRNCTIRDCSALDDGGGVYMYTGRIGLCRVENCRAADVGGGLWLGIGGSPITLHNVAIRNCRARNGGGLRLAANVLSASNVLIHSCAAKNHGGGIYMATGSVRLSLSTITANRASVDGSGLFNAGGHLQIESCIVWRNESRSGAANLAYDPAWAMPPVVSHSVVQNGWVGPGASNLDQDPRFVNPAHANFALAGSSPCIDSGDDASLPGEDTLDVDGDGETAERLPLDLGGATRRRGIRVDMGAFESR